MKSELRLQPHSVIPDACVIEVWYDGKLIATVAGADGPGVRVITKHKLYAHPQEAACVMPENLPNVMEVSIDS